MYVRLICQVRRSGKLLSQWRYTVRCLGTHRMIAPGGMPLYRNGSTSENENGSFPALKEDPYLSLLSSITVSALAPPETA